MNSTYLFLALSRGGWGEAAFGIKLAADLARQGDKPIFVTHARNTPLFTGGVFEFYEVGDHIGTLIKLLIKSIIHDRKVTAVVLCDFMTADGVFRQFGVDAQFLLEFGIPVIAVDTWHQAESGNVIDVFLDKEIQIRDWLKTLPKLQPCPIVRPTASRRTCNFLDEPVSRSRRVRQHLRANLGLDESDRAILFCTANWQQSIYADHNGDRLAEQFPDLLGQYLEGVDSHVHLIHVGPSEINGFKRLGARYHWLPPLGSQFDSVFGAVDLLLSANVSATTVGKAIASCLPVIVLQNSCCARTYDEAVSWLSPQASRAVLEWLPKALPLYPFKLWPLGFHGFLSPLLRDNTYSEAFSSVEWLSQASVTETIVDLLFEPAVIEALQHRQVSYRRELGGLLSPGDALRGALEDQTCLH